MESFNLKKLNAVEVKEQCWVKISNRFVALDNLHGGGGGGNDDEEHQKGLGKY
jgi:hypothetical protein